MSFTFFPDSVGFCKCQDKNQEIEGKQRLPGHRNVYQSFFHNQILCAVIVIKTHELPWCVESTFVNIDSHIFNFV